MVADDFYSRTELLIQTEGVDRLKSSHVLVVGLGGVGGYAAEQLCRAGVGKLTIVDGDVVNASNINRQVIALKTTVGQPKAELFHQRFSDINPDCKVIAIQEFLRDERMIDLLENGHFDYIVDAIDTLSPKVFLIFHAHRLGIPMVSAMGSAGKLDPTKIEVCDISQSRICPLAAMVRKYLHKLGVYDGVKVVFSPEKSIQSAVVEDRSQNKRTTVGAISYMPPIFGCFCASVVIRDLIEKR